METFVRKRSYAEKNSFKSYYVVWKQVERHLIFVFYILFKSYYVVWKPLNLIRNELDCYKFKSYYVVWKPNFPAILRLPAPGLNRTM